MQRSFPAGGEGELRRGAGCRNAMPHPVVRLAALCGGAALAVAATPASQIKTAPDWSIELVHAVPKPTQGSWVALAVSPKGSFYAADQKGGLWRMKLDAEGKALPPEKVEARPKGAHGLLFAHGHLYACEGEGGNGHIWRLTDADGDGVFEEQAPIRRLPGSGGEHGPHQMILDTDGSLLVVAGNFTKLPADERPSPPRRWGEDVLSPRLEDPRGHAVGLRVPGGWVGRMDKDGGNWQVVSTGWRNAYDLAMGPGGEVFSWDSDMEWDVGTPWWRPTRIHLVNPGSEYGWRSGVANQPDHFADSLPPVLNMGPASPTGVVFGTGGRMPERYQRALFACDWTFGTLHAVHLRPDGGGWAGEKEPIAWGRPFALTDVVVHPRDGHLYVLTGGRNGDSGLYRIRYTGSASTAPAPAVELTAEQRLRRDLEARRLAGPSAENLRRSLAHLGSADRWIRFAARQLLEAHPVSDWRDQAAAAVGQAGPDLRLQLALALARCGEPTDLARALALARGALGKGADLRLRRDQARVLAVAVARLGKPEGDLGDWAARQLPTGDFELDRQLGELAVHLGSAEAAPRLVRMMATARDPEPTVDRELVARNPNYAKAFLDTLATRPASRKIGLAELLCHAKVGWTPELRAAYFSHFAELGAAQGGMSLQGYVAAIRRTALANTPEAERAGLEKPKVAAPAAERPAPEGPGKAWTVEQSVALAAAKGGKGRDFARGERMFKATLCADCHKLGAVGGGSGPDLTALGSRMGVREIAEAVIQPSKVVSDQYANTVVVRRDGTQVVGRVIAREGDLVKVATNPFDLGDPAGHVGINTSDIAEETPAASSPMPAGLANSLGEEAWLDLLAYLRSGGNPQDPAFHK
jgi:putative heme-binding domain-containing protein